MVVPNIPRHYFIWYAVFKEKNKNKNTNKYLQMDHGPAPVSTLEWIKMNKCSLFSCKFHNEMSWNFHKLDSLLMVE